MLKRIIGYFWATLAVVFLVGNSFLMYRGAVQLVADPALQVLFGAIAICVPWALAVLPFQFSMAWKRTIFGLWRPTGDFVIVAIFYCLFIVYNATNGSSAITNTRAVLVAGKQQDIDRLKALKSQREALAREQKSLPEYRPAATVASLIAAEKQSRRWQASGECSDATSKATREYCASVQKLEAEQAAAARGEELLKKLAELDDKISASGPVAEEADPQASAISRWTGWTQEDIRAGAGFLGPLVLEFGSLFFLLLAGRNLGFSHNLAEDAPPSPKKGGSTPEEPAARIPPKEGLSRPMEASLGLITRQRQLCENFFKNCTRHSRDGHLPEREWFEHYAAVCEKSHDNPLPIESFRRIAATYVPSIQQLDGVTYYSGVLPLVRNDA